MICYKDRTFCGSDCTNTACSRHFGDDDLEAAKKWWDGEKPPIMFAAMSHDCQSYTTEGTDK